MRRLQWLLAVCLVASAILLTDGAHTTSGRKFTMRLRAREVEVPAVGVYSSASSEIKAATCLACLGGLQVLRCQPKPKDCLFHQNSEELKQYVFDNACDAASTFVTSAINPSSSVKVQGSALGGPFKAVCSEMVKKINPTTLDWKISTLRLCGKYCDTPFGVQPKFTQTVSPAQQRSAQAIGVVATLSAGLRDANKGPQQQQPRQQQRQQPVQQGGQNNAPQPKVDKPARINDLKTTEISVNFKCPLLTLWAHLAENPPPTSSKPEAEYKNAWALGGKPHSAQERSNSGWYVVQSRYQKETFGWFSPVSQPLTDDPGTAGTDPMALDTKYKQSLSPGDAVSRPLYGGVNYLKFLSGFDPRASTYGACVINLNQAFNGLSTFALRDTYPYGMLPDAGCAERCKHPLWYCMSPMNDATNAISCLESSIEMPSNAVGATLKARDAYVLDRATYKAVLKDDVKQVTASLLKRTFTTPQGAPVGIPAMEAQIWSRVYFEQSTVASVGVDFIDTFGTILAQKEKFNGQDIGELSVDHNIWEFCARTKTSLYYYWDSTDPIANEGDHVNTKFQFESTAKLNVVTKAGLKDRFLALAKSVAALRQVQYNILKTKGAAEQAQGLVAFLRGLKDTFNALNRLFSS